MLNQYEDIYISPEWFSLRKIIKNNEAKIQQTKLGISVLEYLDADYYTMASYFLIPLFEGDRGIVSHGMKFIEKRGMSKTVFLAMEYRGIINSSPKKSPLLEVNNMLKASKILQEIEKPNSCKEWFDVLDVSKQIYNKICVYLKI